MKKEDLEDLLTRTVALIMVPVMGILVESQTEGIHVDPDEAVAKLSKDMKAIALKSILDWEHIRPGGLGSEWIRDNLRKLEGEIFN